jgi:asparagine synthetase B (glutamine-hydrolysing)
MKIDKLLEQVIAKNSKSKTVAVLLSGGVDSNSLACAANRLGKKVVAYTFQIKDRRSLDAEKALAVCEAMNWKCVTIDVPYSQIERDFIRLRREFNCVKKTHFECTFPFLYVYPMISEKEVLTGFGADGHYGLSRKALDPKKANVKASKSAFDAYRREYFSQENVTGYNQQLLLGKKYKKKLISPYLDPDVIKFFLSYNWRELNTPRQKEIVRSAYEQEFSEIPHLTQHRNLQLAAGVDHLFEERLLRSKKINFKRRVRMLDVYRDWQS